MLLRTRRFAMGIVLGIASLGVTALPAEARKGDRDGHEHGDREDRHDEACQGGLIGGPCCAGGAGGGGRHGHRHDRDHGHGHGGGHGGGGCSSSASASSAPT